MNPKNSRYTHFFKKGSGITSRKSEESRPFAKMSYAQKVRYVHRVLFYLLEENPDDEGIAEFVAVGKRELIGSKAERLFFVLSNEKLNTSLAAISFCLLLLFGNPCATYLHESRKEELSTIEETTL